MGLGRLSGKGAACDGVSSTSRAVACPMTPTRIQPLTRSGSWALEGGYRRRARKCLDLLEERVQVWREQHPGVAKGGSRVSPDDFNALDEIHLLSDSTVVFAAMAVESFLNLYGVIRLGETFYSHNLERLGTGQKLAAILGTCCSALITSDDEIAQVVTSLSKRRNELVHPKTQEVRSRRQQPVAQPPLLAARNAVKD